MTHSTLIAISDKRRAIDKLSGMGYKLRADTDIPQLAKIITGRKGNKCPKDRLEQGRIVQRFLEGDESATETLAPLMPLHRPTLAEKLAMERAHELFSEPGLTDRMKSAA